MIKIGTKQVNKIVINNKEVLKVIQGDGTSTGILKYQAGSTPTPTLGRYVLQGAIIGGTQTFIIYDTETETVIWQGDVSTNIQPAGNGIYRLDYSFIQHAIQNIGAYSNNTNITNLIFNPNLTVTMNGRNTRYLKAVNYNNDIVFKTTAKGTSYWGTSNVTIPWNRTNLESDYWTTISAYITGMDGIEDISCQNKSINTLNNYFTRIECYTTNTYATTSTDLTAIGGIGVLVFFDITS